MINVPIHALTTRCPLILINGVPEWSIRVPFACKDRPDDSAYETQPRDTLPKLAFRFLNDVKLWWVIWDDNSDVLSGSPMYLEPGVLLRIPSKQTVESEILHDGQQL